MSLSKNFFFFDKKLVKEIETYIIVYNELLRINKLYTY
jgi:hypothetical protein